MQKNLDISPPANQLPPPPPWADAWAHPEYYEGVTLRRIVAYFLDIIFLGIVGIILWFILSFFTIISLGLLAPLQALILILLPFVYAITMIAQPKSATFGMRIMGVRVLSLVPISERDGCPTPLQAFIQTVGFYGSLAITGSLIFLVALFNPRRRTLHDWMAGIVVVRSNPSV